MPKTTTLTIRISAEIKDRLEKLATKHHRSKAYLAVQALERYLDDGPSRKHDRDRVLAIQKANERAPAGDERTGEPLTVTRADGNDFVIMSAQEWESIQKTLHITSSPENVRRLRAAHSEIEVEIARRKKAAA